MNTMEIDIIRTKDGWSYRDHQTHRLISKIRTVRNMPGKYYWKTYDEFRDASPEQANRELQEFLRQRARSLGMDKVEFNSCVDQELQDNVSKILEFFQPKTQSHGFVNSDGTVMVNATQIAKAFGKNVSEWLRNRKTKEFMQTLSTVKAIPLENLVIINRGVIGEQGT